MAGILRKINSFVRFALLFAVLIFIVGLPKISRAQEKNSEYGTYTVQDGDTLSDILSRFNIKPLYGKNGSIKKFSRVNVHTVKKNGDLIFPGSVIYLPISVEAVAEVIKQEKIEAAIDVRKPATEVAPGTPAPACPEPEKKPVLDPVYASAETASSDVAVTFIGGYSSMQGTDRSTGDTSKLLSKLETGARLEWSQNWDDTDSTSIFVIYQNRNLEPTLNDVTLTNSSMGVSSFGLGYKKVLSNSWALRMEMEYMQALFYQNNPGTGTGLQINAVPLLRLHPQLEYLVLERKPLSLGLQAGVSYFGSTSYGDYSVDSGYGYNLDLSLRHTFTNHNFIQCQAYYEERHQNTSELLFVERDVGTRCGFSWRFQ